MSETPNEGSAPAAAPPAAPAAESKAEPRDAEQGAVDTVRRRWVLAFGVIGWLVTVIGPAISFNAKLALSSNSGTEFQAFFLIVTTVLFLLTWRLLDGLPLWSLGVAAVLAVLSFVAYSQAKDEWTCLSYLDPSPLVMGTVLLPEAAAHLAKENPPPATCEAVMENWGATLTKSGRKTGSGSGSSPCSGSTPWRGCRSRFSLSAQRGAASRNGARQGECLSSNPQAVAFGSVPACRLLVHGGRAKRRGAGRGGGPAR